MTLTLAQKAEVETQAPHLRGQVAPRPFDEVSR